MEPIPEKLVEIPFSEIPPETVRAIAESFILREGTNYGREEVAMNTKVDQVIRQIESGKVLVIFESETETCTLLTAEELKLAKARQMTADAASH